jgi:hypothetical protein
MFLAFCRFRRWAGLVAATTIVAAVPPVMVASTAVPAYANSGYSIHMGVDGCDLGNATAARAFWNNTPYYNFGIYIGGSSGGCLMNDASFVSNLRMMGWQLMPIWFGPQAPCAKAGSRTNFSSNTSTAYSQGKGEAAAAYNALVALGMSVSNTPVIYDLEAWNTGSTSCVNAVRSFIQGWTDQLHLPPAQQAGVYGSTCGSGLADLASLAPPPDFITGASWDNTMSTSVMPCVSGLWTFRQRHKQYAGDHVETWNGVSAKVDSDCSNGPVYPGPNATTLPQGCA